MYLGPQVREVIVKKLHEEVEGKCTGKTGYVIKVVNVKHMSAGILQEGTGKVCYLVQYEAIVFRLFRNEVTDTIVTQVNKHGFLARAGPQELFVSRHHIPRDFEFSGGDSPSYCAADSSRIQVDAVVRVRIQGILIDATEIRVVGSCLGHSLGVISPSS